MFNFSHNVKLYYFGMLRWHYWMETITSSKRNWNQRVLFRKATLSTSDFIQHLCLLGSGTLRMAVGLTNLEGWRVAERGRSKGWIMPQHLNTSPLRISLPEQHCRMFIVNRWDKSAAQNSNWGNLLLSDPFQLALSKSQRPFPGVAEPLQVIFFPAHHQNIEWEQHSLRVYPKQPNTSMSMSKQHKLMQHKPDSVWCHTFNILSL